MPPKKRHRTSAVCNEEGESVHSACGDYGSLPETSADQNEEGSILNSDNDDNNICTLSLQFDPDNTFTPQDNDDSCCTQSDINEVNTSGLRENPQDFEISQVDASVSHDTSYGAAFSNTSKDSNFTASPLPDLNLTNIINNQIMVFMNKHLHDINTSIPQNENLDISAAVTEGFENENCAEVTYHSGYEESQTDTSLQFEQSGFLDRTTEVLQAGHEASTPMKQRPAPLTFVDYDDNNLSEISSASSSASEQEEEGTDTDDNQDHQHNETSVRMSESAVDEIISLNDTCNVSVAECEEIHSQAQLFNTQTIHDHSEITINKGILEIMNLYVKNQLSKQGLERTVKTFCKFLPEDHRFPSSAHNILKYVTSLAPPVEASEHFYCKECLFYYGETTGLCETCNVPTPTGRFFYFDVKALIKYFFESRDLASVMDSFDVNASGSEGVRFASDGSVYKSVNASRGKYDLTIILGSDGVRIRKGSKRELWLAMITFAELPPHLQRSYLTVIGVWYDQKKPDMKIFLLAFAEAMASLDSNGCEWTHPITQERQISCVRFSVCELDSPARAIVQNVSQFNGRYGCNLCEIKTRRVPKLPHEKRARRVYYYSTARLRTKERMFAQAAEAAAGMKIVKGVKGPSVLSIIPSADVSKCIVPEYMHSVLLGVTKQVLGIWTSNPGPWSLKNRISEIDCYLDSFKHPSFVHRAKRQLLSLKFWKASDFYYFLLFESLPSLQNHLPSKYFQHFILLVKGIFNLLRTSITDEAIDEADMLLRLFALEFGTLYGNRELTSNVHQLLHLALCVRRFGPLHCWGAFSMEDLNGLIAKRTHGTNLVDQEIVNNVKICQGIGMLKNFVNGLIPDGSNKNQAYSPGKMLGPGRKLPLPPEELQLFQDEEPLIFSRAHLGYDQFTSLLYKKTESEDFYVTWTDNDCENKLGRIKYFAQTKSGDFVVINLFGIDHTQVFFHTETQKCVDHLIPVSPTDTLVAVNFHDIVASISKVGKKSNFVYKRPNNYRYLM